jgi:hypothetical protein
MPLAIPVFSGNLPAYSLQTGAKVGFVREAIKAAIQEAGGDIDKAALAACVAIDNEVGLTGNGWFDDDPEVYAAIKEYWQKRNAQ